MAKDPDQQRFNHKRDIKAMRKEPPFGYRTREEQLEDDRYMSGLKYAYQKVPFIIQNNELANEVEEIFRDAQKRAAMIPFELECKKRFDLLLKELKELGVKEVWVGDPPPNRHWPDDWNHTHCLFCVPPMTRSFRFPSFFDVCGRYFSAQCGNGHSVADQVQISVVLPESYRGKHVL